MKTGKTGGSAAYQILCLAAVGIILTFVGCSLQMGSDEEDLPVLTICTVQSNSAAANERIAAALSEITSEKIGCRVEVTGFSMSDYEQELSYLYVSRELPDLMGIFELYNLERWIEKGAVVPIEELLDPYRENLDQYIGEKEWLVAEMDGHQYGIPSSVTEDKCMGFIFRRDICEELGIDWRQINSLESLHDMLSTVKAAYPEMDMIVPHNGKIIPNIGQDRLNNNLGVLLVRGQNELKAENLYETEYFKELCLQMRQWASEGLFMEDAYRGIESRQNYLALGNAFGGFLNLSEVSLDNMGRYNEYPMAAVQLSPKVTDSDSSNMVWCISRDCEEPEMAMKLLHLLFTDPEAARLLAYGQEGIDYDRVDKDCVTGCSDSPEPEQDRWNSSRWSWPVGISIERWLVNGEDQSQYIAFWDEPVIESAAMGFLFDASEVRTEVDACRAIIDKYENPLLCGVLDPETAIPRLLRELEIAGIDRVIEEKQRQLDAFGERN